MDRLAVAIALLLLALASPASSLDWGGIEPGVTTVEQVRERYGAPSKEARPKVDGYDTLQWVYEGTRAPTGLDRLTVDFGLLAATGYKPSVVRIFSIEPKPRIFGRNTVVQGWGVPDTVTKNQDGTSTVVWKQGLHAIFDKGDENAVIMVFSMPQPVGSASPSAPPAASAPTPSPPKR